MVYFTLAYSEQSIPGGSQGRKPSREAGPDGEAMEDTYRVWPCSPWLALSGPPSTLPEDECLVLTCY